MTINQPAYAPGDVVYLRESAAMGHLEAVSINGLSYNKGQWLYSIQARVGSPTAQSTFGDRTSAVNGQILQFTESELIVLCDALALAEANAQRTLDKIKAQRASLCPE